VSLAALSAHTAVTSSGLLPYLITDGRPLAIAVIAYYTVKAAVFLLASVVGICTKNKDRREVCLKLAEMICRGWPLPRLPGSRA
jgi:hypothetical protein